MAIYILQNAEMPWGDYGNILLSGMTSHLNRKNGLLQLERTGPFVPPITESGISEIVVTDAFKQQLEKSGLSGFNFQPVIKAHIVRLEWEKWSRTANEPPEYPETGEPEDYILARPHSPELADEISDLWELQLQEHAEVERVQVGSNAWDANIYVLLSSWNGTDWFRAKTVGYTYISEKAKVWLEQRVSEWVQFEPALTK
jgi:hypothetical protein